MYQEGFLPLNENGKIDSRDETVLEGDFEQKNSDWNLLKL